MGAESPRTQHSLTYTIPALPVASRKKDPATGKMVKTTKLRHKLVGYYTQGSRPNFARLKEYHDWKDHVRARTPQALHDHVRKYGLGAAAPGVRVDVVCYFENGTHNDPENVRKSIVDAVFPSDKWVYGFHLHPCYDREHPRVEVTVSYEVPAPETP